MFLWRAGWLLVFLQVPNRFLNVFNAGWLAGWLAVCFPPSFQWCSQGSQLLAACSGFSMFLLAAGWLLVFLMVFSGVLLDGWLAACCPLDFQRFSNVFHGLSLVVGWLAGWLLVFPWVKNRFLKSYHWCLVGWLSGCLAGLLLFLRCSTVFVRFPMVVG